MSSIRSLQGQDVDVDDVQPVKEVASEAALGHQLFEVLIGGGNRAKIYSDQGVAPKPLELLLFQDPQELGLHFQRQVPDFIQEYGALRWASSNFPALPPSRAPVKAPFS